MKCGCKIRYKCAAGLEGQVPEAAEIVYCPLHAAAGDLLEACNATLIGLEQLLSADGTLGNQLKSAIQKAQTKES